MKEFLLKLPHFLLSSITVVAVIYITLMPQSMVEPDVRIFDNADKVVHILMMLCVSLALAFDFIKQGRQPVGLPSSYNWWIFIAVAAFGGAIEIAQGLMCFDRECDFFDFVSDAVGAAIGLFIACRYSLRLARWLYA